MTCAGLKRIISSTSSHRLGLELDQALESREQVSDDVLRDWLALERARTAAQWRPVRATDVRIAEELARLESTSAEADADEVLNVDRLVAWSRVSHLVQVSGTALGGGTGRVHAVLVAASKVWSIKHAPSATLHSHMLFHHLYALPQ